MRNTLYLDLDRPIIYISSDDRCFEPEEQHITRDCKEYVLLIMFHGKLTFSENGYETALSGGSWYIQVPGLQSPSQEPCLSPRYYYVHFSASLCDADAVHSMPLYGTFLPDQIEQYIQRLRRAAQLPFTSNLERQTAFTELLLSLNTTQTNNSENTLAERVLIFLQGCLPFVPSMNDISIRFGYSADHITRSFKQTYGITPVQMLNRLRLQHACTLLDTSARSIQMISQECGWTASEIFYRAFHKEYGFSPMQYRKRKTRRK